MSKTIVLDDEALTRLDERRRPDEDYSAVIRRCLPRQRTFEEILDTLRSGPSLETLDAADESLKRRRRRPRKPRA
jgi:predicted CopG family antitoxin